MIKASFGPTIIANGPQSKYEKPCANQNKHNAPKKAVTDKAEELYSRVVYQFNTNYVPNPPFNNKAS